MKLRKRSREQRRRLTLSTNRRIFLTRSRQTWVKKFKEDLKRKNGLRNYQKTIFIKLLRNYIKKYFLPEFSIVHAKAWVNNHSWISIPECTNGLAGDCKSQMEDSNSLCKRTSYVKLIRMKNVHKSSYPMTLTATATTLNEPNSNMSDAADDTNTFGTVTDEDDATNVNLQMQIQNRDNCENSNENSDSSSDDDDDASSEEDNNEESTGLYYEQNLASDSNENYDESLNDTMNCDNETYNHSRDNSVDEEIENGGNLNHEPTAQFLTVVYDKLKPINEKLSSIGAAIEDAMSAITNFKSDAQNASMNLLNSCHLQFPHSHESELPTGGGNLLEKLANSYTLAQFRTVETNVLTSVKYVRNMGYFAEFENGNIEQICFSPLQNLAPYNLPTPSKSPHNNHSQFPQTTIYPSPNNDNYNNQTSSSEQLSTSLNLTNFNGNSPLSYNNLINSTTTSTPLYYASENELNLTTTPIHNVNFQANETERPNFTSNYQAIGNENIVSGNILQQMNSISIRPAVIKLTNSHQMNLGSLVRNTFS